MFGSYAIAAFAMQSRVNIVRASALLYSQRKDSAEVDHKTKPVLFLLTTIKKTNSTEIF